MSDAPNGGLRRQRDRRRAGRGLRDWTSALPGWGEGAHHTALGQHWALPRDLSHSGQSPWCFSWGSWAAGVLAAQRGLRTAPDSALPPPHALQEGWALGARPSWHLGRLLPDTITPGLLPQRRPWTQAPRDTEQRAGCEADTWLCPLLPPLPPGGTGKRDWETRGQQQGQGGRLGSLVEWATGHPSSRAHTQRNVPNELDQGQRHRASQGSDTKW